MKNNKLIAEFMGYPHMTDAVDDRTIAYDIGGSIMNVDNTHNENDDNVFHPDDMQFRTSWDWLMPVVESCFERLDARDTSADEIKRHLLVCNLKGVHQSVVEFIKEVNKLT